jgi:hypothetical protein
MADLQDLHTALQLLAAGGKTAKLSFYFVAEDGKLQSGSIAVEQGQLCHINFRGLPPEQAMAQIPHLQFAKVSSLPAVTVDHGPNPVRMAVLLDRFDPRHRPAPAPATSVVAAPEPAPAPAVAVVPKPAHIFYSHLSLQADALAVLEPLFGVGAEHKMEEFAKLSPPMQHPRDFLERCRQHAAMMLGPRKAEELFQPIFDKL